MEEGNAKVTADAAELPKTQPDLPKKANTVVKTLQTLSANPVEEPKTPTTPPLAKINGVSEDDEEMTTTTTTTTAATTTTTTEKENENENKESSEKLDLDKKPDGG